MAFQIVVRESVRYMLSGALIVGAWWGSDRLFGQNAAWGLGIIVAPSLLYGIPVRQWSVTSMAPITDQVGKILLS